MQALQITHSAATGETAGDPFTLSEPVSADRADDAISSSSELSSSRPRLVTRPGAPLRAGPRGARPLSEHVGLSFWVPHV